MARKTRKLKSTPGTTRTKPLILPDRLIAMPSRLTSCSFAFGKSSYARALGGCKLDWLHKR
jgi:hypothetical protein